MAAAAGLATAMALIALGAAPAAAAAAVHAASSHQGGGLVAATDDGKLQGKHDEGIDQFLGIPYAAPPVGVLRWQAPQPVQPWPGIRGATSYGHRCAQLPSGNGPREDTENCLYLNVFTPPPPSPARPRRAAGPGHDSRRRAGQRAGDQHDGSLIVNTDHIIVVSVNYRLGVFGFLDVPGLGASPRDRERQLRPARPGGRAAVGAAQHRRVRW